MNRCPSVLSLVVVAAFTLAAEAASAQLVVRIGHVGPLTGGIAHLGKDNELGARLAIEDLNARGIRISGQSVTWELLSEDDAADPRQAAAAATKLVDARVGGVIGHLNSSTTIRASKIYHDAGIVQISPSATDPKYTRQGFDTAFRVVAHQGQLGGALGRYAVRDLKARRIAIIDDRSPYGQGIADEFQKAVTAAGGQLVGRRFLIDKETDVLALVTELKGARPDLVFFGGIDAAAGPMLRQMKQLGIDARFMGGDGICSNELVKLAGGAMADDQVICAETGGVTKDREGAMDDFRMRFRQRTGQDVKMYAPYVYDATMVMAAAMQRAGSADPRKYLPELRKISYDGVTGRIRFDDRGDIRSGPLTLYTYRGGQRERMDVVK